MKKSSFTSFKQKYGVSFLLFLIFEIIAVALTLKSGNIFYLANFSYIGSALAVSLALYANGKTYARRLVQFLIGSYILVYLGILSHENMQIEGFWYYLFLGTFEAAVIHYLVAKILGPLLFGRGWCGYACWSAMIFDLLPYKTPQKPRKNLGFLRYITFSASIIFVALLFYFNAANIALIMWYAFIVGNILYYISGIVLAFLFKDNRAFCKYLCPVTVFLKPASYFALLRVKCDTSKCIACGKCRRVCPMEVDMTDNSRKRANGTECILCLNCINACPKKALKL